MKLNADESGQGEGDFSVSGRPHICHMQSADLEDRAVCVSACKPEPIAAVPPVYVWLARPPDGSVVSLLL